jgi:hypothetical protein
MSEDKSKKAEPIVYLYVEGGVVQGARANVPGIAVEIFDVEDKADEGLNDDAIEAEWDKIEEQCPHPIF